MMTVRWSWWYWSLHVEGNKNHWPGWWDQSIIANYVPWGFCAASNYGLFLIHGDIWIGINYFGVVLIIEFEFVNYMYIPSSFCRVFLISNFVLSYTWYVKITCQTQETDLIVWQSPWAVLVIIYKNICMCICILFFFFFFDESVYVSCCNWWSWPLHETFLCPHVIPHKLLHTVPLLDSLLISLSICTWLVTWLFFVSQRHMRRSYKLYM